ncbi:hypothetical protein [Burkholderia sp. AU38729]|uniref:hypothetical protein n=1 Tax=Burkholderia sp. AU38729 TaxID=2879633 RepID=UPI001CF5E58F|nr:hypothetical protein [Burkholderia sp. AU38729]MCA8061283.1 hypothetical protein [Burkholderia sp. AU38729]
MASLLMVLLGIMDFLNIKISLSLSLSLGHVRQVPLLADEAFVYSEGGYSFLYPTNKKRIGDFIAYEVVNVLCKGGSEGRERPATCYVAALVFEGDVNMNPTVFVFSIVDQPPTSDGNISKQAVRKIGVINSIIRSIKVYR